MNATHSTLGLLLSNSFRHRIPTKDSSYIYNNTMLRQQRIQVLFILIPFLNLYAGSKPPSDDRLSSAEINPTADAIIGVTLTMRLAEINSSCSPNIFVGSMYTYDAIEWALSLLNQKTGNVFGVPVNDSFIPGITLGLKIRDDCSKPELVLKNAITLLSQLGANRQTYRQKKPLFLGMLGSTFSTTTMPLATFLGSSGIPLISSQSFAAKLSDKKMYPTFMRTCPNDVFFQKAINALLDKFNWKAFSIIYSDDTYGVAAANTAIQFAIEKNMCVLASIAISINPNVKVEHYQKALQMIKRSLISSKVVLFFSTSIASVTSVLNIASGSADYHSIQWIFAEVVGTREFLLHPFPNIADGSFTFAFYFPPLHELTNYLIKRNLKQLKFTNPWAIHYYMQSNKCVLPNFKKYDIYTNFSRCTQRQEERAHYKEDPFHGSALIAIYTYAHALKTAWKENCNSYPGVCPKLTKLTHRKFLKKYLRKTQFTFNERERGPDEFHGIKVKFNENGDLENQTFAVYNYQKEKGKLVKVMYYHTNTETLQTLSPPRFHNAQNPSEPIQIQSWKSSSCAKKTPFAPPNL